MRPPYRVLFASSLSVLGFEILLVRLFTISLSYHYAALIISISMIGLVVGATMVRLTGCRPFRLNLSPPGLLGALAFILSLSYPIVFLVLSIVPLDTHRMLWEHTQLLYLIFFILACALPFFIYGVIICVALSSWADRVSAIYAADLLGAACGVAFVLLLLDFAKIEYALILVSAVPCALAFIASPGKVFRVIALLPILALYGLIGLGFVTLPMSPYKGLMQALKDDDARLVATTFSSHSRVDVFENSRMKFAPGLSLAYAEPVPAGRGIAVDGDIAGVLMDGPAAKGLRFLDHLPSALPYRLGGPRNVVVVGLRNSLDLIQPYYFGASNVYKAEPDPSVADTVKKHYGARSRYGQFLYRASGRNAIRNIPVRPDLIVVSRVGFFPSGAFGLQEDYDTTVEALKHYWSYLHEKGYLFIQMFIVPPPRYELRMMNNIISALKSLGITDASGHLLVYRSWDTMNFLVKKTAFSPGELNAARRFLASRQFDLLYPISKNAPRFISGGTDYNALFGAITTPGPRERFVRTYPFDIRTTTDDRPFFHYFLKIRSIGKVYDLTGGQWAYFLHEGMTLPFVLVFVLVISTAIFVITLLVSKPRGTYGARITPKTMQTMLPYFALIGLSYMFVEVFFIHKLILPFGSPVRAFSITVITILLTSGMGSLLSGFLNERKSLYLMGLAPPCLLLCVPLLEFGGGSAFTVLPMIPIGIVLGLFFPSGIRSISSYGEGSIALAYALNGAASIIAPPLASVIAVVLGLRSLLLFAAVLYVTALFVIRVRLLHGR